MNIWNDRSIPCPPNSTILYSRNKLETICQLANQKSYSTDQICPETWANSVKHLLSKAVNKVSQSHEFLDLEFKCLLSFIYQGGGVHKKEKYFHAAKKVGKCLKRWKEMYLCKLILIARDMISVEYNENQKIRLPSPRYFYYLLHRMIGGFYLLKKAVSYCIEAGFYFKAKMALGHTLAIVTLGLAIIGRIRALVLDMCSTISASSDELYPYLISVAEEESLDTENLPNNLKEELRRFIEKEEDNIRTDHMVENSKQGNDHCEINSDEDLNNDLSYMNMDQDVNVGESDTSIYGNKNKKLKLDVNNRCATASLIEDFSYVTGCETEDLGEYISPKKNKPFKNLSKSGKDGKSSQNRTINTDENYNDKFSPTSNCDLKISKKRKRKNKNKKINQQ